jgi:hypothetical protein
MDLEPSGREVVQVNLLQPNPLKTQVIKKPKNAALIISKSGVKLLSLLAIKVTPLTRLLFNESIREGDHKIAFFYYRQQQLLKIRLLWILKFQNAR